MDEQEQAIQFMRGGLLSLEDHAMRLRRLTGGLSEKKNMEMASIIGRAFQILDDLQRSCDARKYAADISHPENPKIVQLKEFISSTRSGGRTK